MEASHIKRASIISRGTRKQHENKISAFLSAVHVLCFFFFIPPSEPDGDLCSRKIRRPTQNLVASNERQSDQTGDKWQKKMDAVAQSEIGGVIAGDERREGEK